MRLRLVAGGGGQEMAGPPPTLPPRRAQSQSTAAWPASPGAAHLPASPPVRSPARWGSMAGSPLLGGPRAGGVGLLVLLLLGLLRPPAALCARPVKVRPRAGSGGGEDATPASLAPAPRMCGDICAGGPGSGRQGQAGSLGIRGAGGGAVSWAQPAAAPCPSLPARRPWRCPWDQHLLREGMRAWMCVRV